MILTKPYAERRVLIIAPRDEAEARSTTVNWDAMGAAGSAFATAGAAGAASVLGAAVAGAILWPGLLGVLAYKGIQSMSGAAAASGPPVPGGVMAVPYHVATRELLFPPGHPLYDHAYGGHPLAAQRYVPLAAFHRFLFEEKVNELMTLLASLGATRVRVTCSRGYRAAAGMSIGVSKGADASASAKGESKHLQEAFFEESFRPKGEPKLPANLVWYPSEASWQAMAHRRLDYNTSKFKAQLSYEDSFGIEGNLKLGLDKLGVKLGGTYSEFESTEWEFEGEFC